MQKLIIAGLVTLGLGFCFVPAQASVLVDQDSGNTTNTLLSDYTNEIGIKFVIGAVDVQLATISMLCSDASGACYTPTEIVKVSDSSVIASCTSPYRIATNTYRCDFATLPKLQAGTEYKAVMCRGGCEVGIYPYYTASTFPRINSYLRWTAGVETSNRLEAYKIMQIFPGDRITVEPSDTWSDYWVISTALILFLLSLGITISISRG